MINSYFSDTEAVEACICRLNVMWCDVMSGAIAHNICTTFLNTEIKNKTNKNKGGWVWKNDEFKKLKRHEQTSNQRSVKIYFLSTQTLHRQQSDITDVLVAVDIANFHLNFDLSDIDSDVDMFH